jgi:hypothetical protein
MRASISGSPPMTPGKFMTSATPMAPCPSSSSATSVWESSAPDDSKGEAGTHDDAHTPKWNGRSRAAAIEGCDAGDAEHVGDLVGSAGDRCRAVGKNGPHELVDPQLGGLEVHVGVDEGG